MDRTAVRSASFEPSARASRWADHVAQVHRAERLSADAVSSAGLPPAQYTVRTVRKLVVAPHVLRVLESQRAPAQLSLF